MQPASLQTPWFRVPDMTCGMSASGGNVENVPTKEMGTMGTRVFVAIAKTPGAPKNAGSRQIKGGAGTCETRGHAKRDVGQLHLRAWRLTTLEFLGEPAVTLSCREAIAGSYSDHVIMAAGCSPQNETERVPSGKAITDTPSLSHATDSLNERSCVTAKQTTHDLFMWLCAWAWTCPCSDGQMGGFPTARPGSCATVG